MKSLLVPIGTQAPNFSLPPAAAAARSLADHRGRPVVLVFYRGQWCQFCRRQLAQLAASYEAIRSLDAGLIAISTESPDDTPDPAATRACPFPLVSDPSMSIIDRYGVRDDTDPAGRQTARPATFILDATGTVRFCHVGADYQDRPAVGAILLALETLAGVQLA